MDSLKRSITSARRPRQVIPMDAPVDEMGVYIPQYQLNRRESVLVDPSDPSAALAKMTVEMVGSLVRRAKSTREGPKRSISTSVKRLDSTAEDGADGDGVRSPRQNSWKGHQKAQSHSQVLELSSTAESSLLKKRPSLRDRFKSLRIKQSTIPDAVEEEEVKTPTDSRFVYRPKHAALDWTDLAAQLQVPRGPSFDASGPSSAPLPRSSIEKNPFNSSLEVPSASLSKSKSTRDPSRNAGHVHSPTPAATAEAIQKNPRQQGECRRCHSKRVQRSMSARKSTAHDPRIQFDWQAYRDAKENGGGLPSPVYKERETTLTLSPRLSLTAPQINTPVITTTDSSGVVSKEWDPFNDYERLVREAEDAERRGSTAASTAKSPGSTSNNPFLRSPEAKSVATMGGGDKRGHTKAAPSWASFQDGDSDVEKVAEYRKSILLTGPAAASVLARDTPPPSPGLPPPTIHVRPQTAAVHKATVVPVFPGGMANRRSATMEREMKPASKEFQPLPPRPLRRQRSVAQRMMDTFVRPLGGKRSQSVKPGNRTPLN
ncbi:hypothetical protein QBC39DRAFT_408197 [Podospora conica]|nr:hypothetical protein QBC39DRAFT_408197 [Schizothecium conicum]